MPGARYEGWHHTHVISKHGDGGAFTPAEEAAPYIEEARKLLGFVTEEAKRNKLGVHTLQRTLPDGTVIIAEMHGDIPRVTIVLSPKAKSKKDVPSNDAFVVWARDAGNTAGIDATHPQQVLVPAWTTFFYVPTTAGYSSFARPKGTYRTRNGTVVFPDGVRHGGNVDWLGAKGQRISWYGPSTRLLTDPYVQLQSQFGKFVFMRGQKLLDVDQYVIDSVHGAPFVERWVMGAALRHVDGADWLYVMHSDAPAQTTSTTPVPAHTIFFSDVLPTGSVSLVLARYRLLRANPVDLALSLHVTPGSREVVWNATGNGAVQPWFFNQSCTEACSMITPVGNTAVFNAGALALSPAGASELLTLRFADGHSAVLYTTAESMLGNSSTAATIACEYQKDVKVPLRCARVSATPGASTSAAAITANKLSLQLYYTSNLGAETLISRRYILHVNLRDDVLLTATEEFYKDIGSVTRGEVRVELFRDGVLVWKYLVPGFQYLTSGLPNADDSLAFTLPLLEGQTIAPTWFVYGTIAGTNGILSYGAWSGAHGMYAYLPYPASEMYGSYAVNAGSGAIAPTAVASVIDGDFDGNRADFDTHYAVLGCATQDNGTGKKITALSCYGLERTTGKSINFIDKDTLASLTGIGGTNARYHPLYLMGQSP